MNRPIWIALLLTAVAAGLALGWRLSNRLTVINAAAQPVASLSIVVGGDTLVFSRLAVGETVSCRFRIRGDDHFAVRGRLDDGSPITADCGYVTCGMWGERVELEIGPRGHVDCR